MRDFWKNKLRIGNLGVTRSAFDELCDAVGPLVVPAREPLPTDKRLFFCFFYKTAAFP